MLGIDAGGSSTSWLLLAGDGETIAAGRVGPVSGIELGPADDEGSAVSPSLANLAELVSACLEHQVPAMVVAGVTGLDSASPVAERFEDFLAARLGVARGRVTVLGDLTTAYLAAFEPGVGVLLYAGTGSAALFLARDGSTIRAGGHGYLIDDAGGGYWIGREALKRVLRRADSSGAAPGGVLARALFARLGGDDWPSVRTAVYGGGRAALAALTPLVAHAAQRGDPDAVAVLATAGSELARLAAVVLGRLGQVLPVSLAGGVAACGEPLLGSLREALPAGVRFSVAGGEPVEAAARLAARLLAGDTALPTAS